MNLQALIAISDLSLTSNSSLDAVPLLADQHQQDRSMMNLTLDFMQQTARESKDAIASKTTSMLGLLLSMEKQDVREADGSTYCITHYLLRSTCGRQVFLPTEISQSLVLVWYTV